MRGPATVPAFALLALSLATSTARADDEAAPAPAPASPAAPAVEPAPALAASSPSPAVGVVGVVGVGEEPPRRQDPTLRKNVAERRGGVVLGVAPGLAFAGASGYPNSERLVGNPDFYSESPLLVGASTTYFLMGALTDYVSFGPMVNVASFESDHWKSTGFGIGFRAEAFPLVSLAPRLADTAIYGQAGVGTTELRAKGNYPSADGTQSFLGLGLHHELRLFRMLGGHVAGGPFVEYDAIFAHTAERHWASIGFRAAWYGGTVALDQR
jgi:hypothetical protein